MSKNNLYEYDRVNEYNYSYLKQYTTTAVFQLNAENGKLFKNYYLPQSRD